ncbi:MAG: oligosaccharide flippase family protein [Candidatus Methanomethylicus sp.]|nr:oligosaccharide flippase family protein [Candidatus Methanomethylicus sp.]
MGAINLSLDKVIRGSFWLYLSGIASNFIAYIYWLLASRFVEPTAIGDAATIIGAVSIIVGFFGFGISSGATRMFGRANGQNDRTSLSSYFVSTLVVSVAFQLLAAVLVLTLGSLFGLTFLDTTFIAVLIAVSGWSGIVTSLFSSTLQTSAIALASIISTILRLTVGLGLLYLGTGFVGIMVAFILTDTIYDVIMLFFCRKLVSFPRPTVAPIKEALKTGIPYWLPALVSTAGTWLGILGIHSLSGSYETGTYYIAFMIASIVYSLPNSFLGLMFPLLSGMEDGRKRATNRSIRLTLAVICPLAAVAIAYPYVPLSMLGESYVASSQALQILLVGCFVAPIAAGFSSLIYAYGKYRYVTLLGLATNIPRVALYAFLVALWGDNGAALTFIIGIFISLVAVYFMARKIGYSVGWSSPLVFASIPIAMAVIMMLTPINWVIGVLLILSVTLVAYARLNLITRADLNEIVTAFISQRRVEIIYPYAKYIMEVLYGE